MPSYETTLTYTYPLVRKVSMTYVQRQFGRFSVLSVFLCLGGLGVALYGGFYSAFFQIIGLCLAGCLIFYFWYGFEIRRRWMETLRRMEIPEARLVVTEEAFLISSKAGSSSIPWNQFIDIWKYDDFWLLFLSKYGQPLTIPLSGMDTVMLQFIENKISRTKT